MCRPLLQISALFFFSALMILAEAKTFGRDRHDSSKRVWTFIDLKSGSSSFLSKDEQIFVIAENAKKVEFCSNDEPLVCFTTEHFQFAIPKTRSTRRWERNGRIYCVIQTFEDIYTPKSKKRALLIFSKSGGDCSDGSRFDEAMVFSETAGLRQISVYSDDGRATVNLISTDRMGFGSAPD